MFYGKKRSSCISTNVLRVLWPLRKDARQRQADSMGAHVFACRGLLRHESYGAGGLPDCRMDTILSACRIATEPERCVI